MQPLRRHSDRAGHRFHQVARQQRNIATRHTATMHVAHLQARSTAAAAAAARPQPAAAAGVQPLPAASAAFVPRHLQSTAAAAPSQLRQQRERRAAVVAAGFGGFGKPAEKKMSKQKACPCGTGLAYKDCCQPYHEGALPQTPEQLMRSRYSAYVKKLWTYVVDTTHPLNPLLTDEAAQQGKPTLKDDVIATCEKLGFEKLKVLSVEPGSNEDEGYVTFQAWFKNVGQLGQRAQGFHTQTFVERSRFLREGGKWLYVDGDQDWKR